MNMDRLYISADIEGICGIADWKETEIGEAQGAYFRMQMTREAAAACEAAVTAGVGDILLKDAHGSGRSIDPSALPRQTRLMRAWTRDPYSMMAGLDATFGGACYIGYHSAAGTDGNPLAHTMNGNAQEIRVNGLLASEFILNAYTAASFGVPSLVLSGDQALCESAKAIAPNMRVVAVSEGIGNASISVHPDLALERIRAAVLDALAADPATMAVDLPDRFKVTVIYRQHALAYRASFYPGVRRNGANGITLTARSWLEVISFIHFAL
jgi:D-amino peptidase